MNTPRALKEDVSGSYVHGGWLVFDAGAACGRIRVEVSAGFIVRSSRLPGRASVESRGQFRWSIRGLRRSQKTVVC